MSEMVEKVARAIASANGDDGTFKAFLPHARAAIEAMRPNDAMISAAYEVFSGKMLMREEDRDLIERVLTVAIDAALSEERG